MSFAVVGDIMLGDQPLAAGFGIGSRCRGNYEAIFADFATEVRGHEFVAGNFEGVLIESRTPGGASPACMTAPASAVRTLRSARLTCLSVANNHSMEYGSVPFRAMLQRFEDGGVTTFGQSARPYVVIEAERQRVGLLGFSTVPALHGSTPEYLLVDPKDDEAVRALESLVAEAKRSCDFLVVMPHWGSEFVTAPAAGQIDLASRLLSSGSDLVAGAHPHVIQESCRLNGSYVFFSLGNLVSDYWQPRMTEGLMIEVEARVPADIRLHRFGADRRLRIRRLAPPVPAASVTPDGLPRVLSDEEYRGRVDRERMRVRRESAVFLFRNAPRIVRHPRLVSWMLRRLWYLTKHRRRLRRDPSGVYSGPMH